MAAIFTVWPTFAFQAQCLLTTKNLFPWYRIFILGRVWAASQHLSFYRFQRSTERCRASVRGHALLRRIEVLKCVGTVDRATAVVACRCDFPPPPPCSPAQPADVSGGLMFPAARWNCQMPKRTLWLAAQLPSASRSRRTAIERVPADWYVTLWTDETRGSAGEIKGPMALVLWADYPPTEVYQAQPTPASPNSSCPDQLAPRVLYEHLPAVQYTNCNLSSSACSEYIDPCNEDVFPWWAQLLFAFCICI